MGDEEKRVDELASSTTYINEVLKIKNSPQTPQTKLELLTILVKDYFRKKYHTPRNMGFSEMIDFFLEKRKAAIATYCHDMVNDLYSGEQIDEGKINVILESTKILITKDLSSKEQILTKISVKEVINPFSAISETPIEKDRILSKNARKLIEKYLKENATDAVEIRNGEKDKKEKTDEEDITYLKKKLSLNQNSVAEETAYSKGDDPEKIEGIDDFQRLKDKIKRRKV